MQRRGDLPRPAEPTTEAAPERQALLAGLDAMGLAGALLDRTGRILARTRGVEVLAADYLDRDSQRFRGCCRESELRLARLHTGLDHFAQTFAVLPRDGAAPILLRAVRLGPPIGSATILLTFAPVGEAGLPPESTLRDAFGLTATEAGVALAIASGRDLRAIARCRGVSLETIRSHLRSVFSKTGTGRQAGLVALIAALRSAP